jgi:NADPH:quinone reductase-like Zn-dependent oxidoreductase
MNAAVVNSFDAPPWYATFPEPVASEAEVLLDVIAAGLHPVVKALASGSHYRSTAALPFIPGVDGVHGSRMVRESISACRGLPLARSANAP